MENLDKTFYLSGWQRSLSSLPAGTPVYVVFGATKEPEAVFLSYVGATLWIGRKGSLDFRTQGFHVEPRVSNVTLLRSGAPSLEEYQSPFLAPIPTDKEYEDS
jgi:hypothetical protein